MNNKVSWICLLLVVVAAFAVVANPREQYSNLPTLYVDVEGGQFIKDKETYLDCTLEFVGAGQDTMFADGRIRGRGNSTWVRGSKLPYRLKFYSKHRLLGAEHADAKNWVLLANNFDKTLIRNAVASFVAKELGQTFVPGARFVDLVLNDRFDGNYQITDHLDLRSKRIDIYEQEEIPQPGDDISGGYFLEVCVDEDGADVFKTDHGRQMRMRSPDLDVQTPEQIAYITEFFNEFERRLFSDGFKDAEDGYRSMVDSISLASWYLTCELSANPDGFYSTNLYKQKGDNRVFFGPVWDFDIAFNNSARMGDSSQLLMSESGFGNSMGTKIWVERMLQDPWFWELLKRQWKTAVESDLEQRTLACVDSLAALLDESQRLNYELYNIGEAYWDEYQLFSTYAEGVDFLKKTIRNRVAFLSDYFKIADNQGGDNGEFKAIVPTSSGIYRIYNLGAQMPIRPDSDEAVALGVDKSGLGEEFLWRLKREGDYFRIVSVANGLAITDTQTHGSHLQLQPESEAITQLWDIQGLDNDANSCVVASVASDLAWNNSGGHAVDGNRLISWTNDSQNSVKGTRQWLFELVDEESAIQRVEIPDYAVTYSRSAQMLRFVAYGYESLEGVLDVYTLSGKKVMSAKISSEVSVAGLEPAVYVLRWYINGQTRVLKFAK